MFDQLERIPYVRRRAIQLYNFWKDADNPPGLWRRTTMESYQRETPDWRILLVSTRSRKPKAKTGPGLVLTTLPPAMTALPSVYHVVAAMPWSCANSI